MGTIFYRVFKRRKLVIVMLHTFSADRARELKRVLADLEVLLQFDIDGVLLENYDWGYFDANRVATEAAEILTAVGREIIKRSTIPVGINVLPNDYWRAFNIARACGMQFTQFDHVTDEFYGCEPVDPVEYLSVRKIFQRSSFSAASIQSTIGCGTRRRRSTNLPSVRRSSPMPWWSPVR